MKYVSTRGKKKYSFEEALFCCYAEDGGVMMPENIPTGKYRICFTKHKAIIDHKCSKKGGQPPLN